MCIRDSVQRLRIGIGIDRHGANAHAARGADDPAGDFAAIGDEKGLDHGHHILNTPKAGRSGIGASSAAANGAILGVSDRSGNTEAVFVSVRNEAAALVDRAFQLVVVC